MKIQLYSTVSLGNHKTDRLNHTQVGWFYFLFGERVQLKTKVEMRQVTYSIFYYHSKLVEI